MKLYYTTVIIPALLCFGARAQQTFQPCGTVQAMEYQETITPGYKASVEAEFELAKAWKTQNNAKSGSVYTIPVVVHIVYNTPEQNLPDSVIFNQIQVLNEDYNRWNADTVNMRPVFDGVKGSPQIEFMLAIVDPQGNPTSGITRTQTSTATFGSFGIFTGDFTDLEKVKSTTDGGMSPWDQDRYLNIWVCNMAIDFGGTQYPALLGYATPPDGLPNWPAGTTLGLSDGVVIQYQAFGGNNSNELDMGTGPIEVLGRTCTHEVGHYLGLRHIWGDGDCTEQDGIDDTPNAAAQSDFDCDDTKNTCVDDILGMDLPDMIENYMDYSAESCQNSFTQGQVDLMHGVLENERYDLVHGNPAGIVEHELSTVRVYPNPANECVQLKLEEGKVVSVTVSDSNGNILYVNESVDATTKLDLSSFARGMYFIVVSTDTTNSQTIKFTKS